MKYLRVEDQSDKDFKHQYTLDRVTKIVRNFKSVGIKISDFSRRDVPVKKSRHKKYFFEVNFFKSGHEPHF